MSQLSFSTKLTIIGLVLTAIISGATAVWALATDRNQIMAQQQVEAKTLTDHEARLRTVERDTAQVAGDVRWIREQMERELRRINAEPAGR